MVLLALLARLPLGGYGYESNELDEVTIGEEAIYERSRLLLFKPVELPSILLPFPGLAMGTLLLLVLFEFIDTLLEPGGGGGGRKVRGEGGMLPTNEEEFVLMEGPNFSLLL